MAKRPAKRESRGSRARSLAAPRCTPNPDVAPHPESPLAGHLKARVLHLRDRSAGDPGAVPDDPGYRLRFLGEGDSWFSTNAVPASANVLEQLHFKLPAAVLTLAQPGDTIRRMSDISRNKLFRDYLAKPTFASRWDAILLSGGGNDVIANAGSLIVRGAGDDPQAYIDDGALAATLREVADGYRRIADLRDSTSVNRGRTMVAHTYAYTTPRPAPAKFAHFIPLSGPWLFPALRLDDITDPTLQQAIADRIIDRLAEALCALQAEIPGFVVVDTRDALERAEHGTTGNSNDWLNEIHPNSAGYRKIADAIVAAL